MNILKSFGKLILSGGIAILILSGIFASYMTMPVHIENVQGNTDYVWPAGSVWMKMTEGISWGKFDENGYNNMQVVEKPDVLILGSSHMEATNVMQDENVAYVLNERLGETYSVYNQGISGHHFLKVCKYLSKTLLMRDEAPRYVVIETSTTTFKEAEIEKLLKDEIEYTPSNSTGLIATLQKFSFLRLLYNQIDGGLLDLFMPESDEKLEIKESNAETINVSAYDNLFKYIETSLQGKNTQVIIAYHPKEKLQDDGTVLYEKEDGTEIFAEKCQEYGIEFVDMTDDFYKMYQESYKVPHGFVTGAIASGHLNADGHAAMAERLAEVILTLEGEDRYADN
ncbi:MAG: hypothetical protein IJA07_07910 [Agathobacter sp.]|nr:hypothetical protein [Agathobacter sp.]